MLQTPALTSLDVPELHQAVVDNYDVSAQVGHIPMARPVGRKISREHKRTMNCLWRHFPKCPHETMFHALLQP